MTSPFERATALEVLTPGVFRTRIPDGWQQGKGAFGGVVVGAMVRALTTIESERTLSSLGADLCGPALPGEARVEVTTLRRGGSMTFFDVHLLQEGVVVARASASFATARAVPPVAIVPVPPVRPAWSAVDVVAVGPPIAPVFAPYFEFRPLSPLPFAGGKEARSAGYIREAEPPAALDAAAIAGLLDSWWPSILAISDMPRAVATVGYTMQLLPDPQILPASEPLYFRAEGVAASDNFFVEMRELWSGERLVAMNQQTFAVLS